MRSLTTTTMSMTVCVPACLSRIGWRKPLCSANNTPRWKRPMPTLPRAARRMINRLVVDLIENSRKLITESGVKNSDDARALAVPLIAHSEPVKKKIHELKQFLRHHLYAHYRVRRMSLKADRVVR